MRPVTLHLNGKTNQADFIYMGDTYTHQFTFEDLQGNPIDKSAKAYVAEIRKRRSSDAAVGTFSTAISGASNNIVTITMTAATTAAITPDNYVWDLRETEGATVLTICTGDALVVDDVSAIP